MAERIDRKRRFRISLPASVRIKHRPQGGKEEATKTVIVDEATVTDNISSTGCYFHLSSRPPLGSIAEIVINVPPDYTGYAENLRCHGKVVRVNKRIRKGKVGVACTIESYSLGSR
jgi:hypothetical protein